MNDWHEIYIVDASGRESFKCIASPMSTASEIKNLQHQIEFAKKHPGAYKFLDVASAVIMLDGIPYGEASELDADALLKELGL